MSDKQSLKETAVEVAVVRDNAGLFNWRIRGDKAREFFLLYAPGIPIVDGWYYAGPFSSEDAAEEAIAEFLRVFSQVCSVEVVEIAPDPRLRN
jgi:hypothetical protein